MCQRSSRSCKPSASVLPGAAEASPRRHPPLSLGSRSRRARLRFGPRGAKRRRLAGHSTGQGGARPLRGAGSTFRASHRPFDSRQPEARAGRSGSGVCVASGVRDGEFRAGLQAAACRHQRLYRSDRGAVRVAARPACAVGGRNGRTALRHTGRNRSRGCDRRLRGGLEEAQVFIIESSVTLQLGAQTRLSQARGHGALGGVKIREEP